MGVLIIVCIVVFEIHSIFVHTFICVLLLMGCLFCLLKFAAFVEECGLGGVYGLGLCMLPVLTVRGGP